MYIVWPMVAGQHFQNAKVSNLLLFVEIAVVTCLINTSVPWDIVFPPIIGRIPF